ncbi:glycosyl transferase family 90 [Paracoccus fistulariae]|uniref:Sulfotransferase family protein n=1 Tax=Paracoccus fistulariae TaxID=658446 RepID=A0ABY7SJY1_9RHOB|nr:glycosyl transferase family 90 [Paracoccus fistulariae]MDB6181042.1 glycosyl transferase family 90 [Paracoccus fistulariae]WCR06337.1 hypothetical protein JHX87_12630 [Paracoccus fistulariae]
MTRKFFQIGFNKCGTTFIAKLFQMNGIPTLHWLEGRLAEDIAYSKLVGRRPLMPWADSVTAFTDMESVRYLNMPVVEAFKEFEFLDQSYPGSVFLLNTRNVEDWVISRYMHRDGTYARAYAQILGVQTGDLADIWADAWQDHLATCRAYFADRPEFIEIDIDDAQPGDYREALAPWFDLPDCPKPPGRRRKQVRRGYLMRLDRMLTPSTRADGITEADRDRVAEMLAMAARPATVSCGARSGGAASFDAASGQVTDCDGTPLPLMRAGDGWYHLDPARLDLLPLANAVNDIAQITDRGVYCLDPRADRQEADYPVLAPTRKRGARNVFLWPMAWSHRLGNNGYLGNPDRAESSWADKLDQPIDSDASQDEVLSHRFIVSRGADPNFLACANSDSVILRQDDWVEDALSIIFQPWQHVIPLSGEAGSLQAQLGWARANPSKSQQIAANARRLCMILADPQVRRRQLSQVLRDYRIATGQE